MAADFLKQTLETSSKGAVTLFGKFRPNGASDPATANIYGNWISSVVHTATGRWTVTMNTEFRKAQGELAVFAQDTVPAGTALVATKALQPDLSAGTFIVESLTEAAGTLALADIASDAAHWIYLSLTIKVSTAPDGSGV